MTQYNTLNVKLSHSQLNKLKSAIKNNTEVTLKISSNVVGGSNDEYNLPHKFHNFPHELARIFNSASSFTSIIKMNLNLMVFIQEIIYLK